MTTTTFTFTFTSINRAIVKSDDFISDFMLLVVLLAIQGTLQAQFGRFTNKGVLLLAECCKFLIVSAFAPAKDKNPSLNSILMLGISSLIYLVQTNLLLRGISLIDNPFLFQLASQSKLITTALASSDKIYSIRKIASLFGILLGISVVLHDSFPNHANESGEKTSKDFIFGIACVLAASLTSAIAGKIYERIVSFDELSIWKTMQLLSAFSIVLLLPSYKEAQKSMQTLSCLIGLASQIVGGFLIAFTVKRHGNLAKVSASSISIAIQALLSDKRTSISTLFGIFLVVGCSFVLNKQ